MSTKFTNMEVSICGLTFIVAGNYTPAEADSDDCPGSDAQVEITGAEVKGQPEADAATILTAMKTRVRTSMFATGGIAFDDGYEMLEEHIRANWGTL